MNLEFNEIRPPQIGLQEHFKVQTKANISDNLNYAPKVV